MDYCGELHDTVILKCETQKNTNEIPKKSNIWDLMLSIATTYSYNEDRYRIWTWSKQNDLIKYLNQKHIVGYNCTRFDLPLILGSDYVCDPNYNIVSKKNEVCFVCTDIFDEIMHPIYHTKIKSDLVEKMSKNPLANRQAYSLYNVYCATSGNIVDKSLYDVKSIEMFRSKKILELVEFNLFKLRFIKQIYEHILDKHYIINGDYDIVRIDDICSSRHPNINYFLPF